MQDDTRITDHTAVIEAARADAGREGAKLVRLSLGQVWRLIHHAPLMTDAEREEFAAALKTR